MIFRLVGSELQIGDVALKTFGQPIELEADVAKELIAHDHTAPLLPDADFQKLGFSAEELRSANSTSFAKKRAQAWAALDELHARLAAGGDFTKSSSKKDAK